MKTPAGQGGGTQLETSELWDVLDEIPARVSLIDRNRRHVYVNSEYAAFIGRPADEILGRTVAEIYGDDEDARLLPFAEAALAGEVVRWEGWVKAPDGSDRFIERVYKPYRQGGEAVQSFFVLVRDRTGHHRAEQEQRRLDRMVSDAIESLPSGFVVYGPDRRVALCNTAYAETMATSPAELLGSTWDEIVRRAADHVRAYDGRPFEDEESWTRHLTARYDLANRQPVEIELADGRVMLFSIHPTADGGRVGIRTDVTALKQMEAALYQSEKLNALGGLLAGVSHELNNPLSVVVGQAQLMRETAEDEATRARAEKIGLAADRCARIVKTFLAMARQSTPSRREVDVNEVIENALEIIGYTLRSADIAVETRLDPGLPAVWADPDQIGQVVMNMIINAEQAMAGQIGERRLEIVSREDALDEAVAIEIRDNGPGIAPEARGRIFDPFFTTKKVGVGTGVGLTISHGIVEDHGGRIEVESAPGKGARFVVTLPRAQPGQVRPAAVAKDAAAGPRGRVLVVDDETEVSETLADILSLAGHRVEIADSGNAALHALAHRSFDVILSDMRMPDLDGHGLYLRIRNAYPELVDRIVFVTGDALSASIREFLARAGLPCLEKPVTPAEVSEAVERAMAKQGGEAEAGGAGPAAP